MLILVLVNDLTGWQVEVYDHGESFVVEQHNVDGAYMGSRTFASETKAISHAVLLS